MRRLLMVVMVSVLIFGAAVPLASAKEEVKVKNNSTFSLDDGWALLKPFGEVLSGHAWLMTEKTQTGQLENPSLRTSAIRRDPSAFSRNLLISKDLGTPIQTESHIAVNPKDKNHLVVATIDYGLPYNAVYASFDAGLTWQGPNRVPSADETDSVGDPVLAFDRNGAVYQTFVSVGEKSYDLGHLSLDIPISDIAIASSNDGLAWQKPVVVNSTKLITKFAKDDSGKLRGVAAFTFPDKPWIAIGPNPVDLARDIIYITHTEFIFYFQVVYLGELPFLKPVVVDATIMMVSSKDSGQSWSYPVVIAQQTLFELGKDANRGKEIKTWLIQGSQPKVAADGALYIAWYDSADDGAGQGKARIYLVKSRDVGQTFSESRAAAEFLEVKYWPGTALFRNVSSFPQMAVGPEGEVFIVFSAKATEKPTDDGDIYFVRSVDGGESFSQPLKLNTDDTDKLQFFPAITVGPLGKIHVMWGDMRDDPAGLKYHIYYSESSDRGSVWQTDTRVSDFPSNPNKGFPEGQFIGDYFSIAASQDDVFLIWADTRLGEAKTYNQKIGFARKTPFPAPEIFISPLQGLAGQEVTVRVANFQPDAKLSIQIGGNIIPAGKTNDKGELEYSFFFPIASKGSHNITVSDESGNTSATSFSVDFGFSDLKVKAGIAAIFLGAFILLGLLFGLLWQRRRS